MPQSFVHYGYIAYVMICLSPFSLLIAGIVLVEPRFRGAGKCTLKLQTCTANFFIRLEIHKINRDTLVLDFFSCKIRKTDLQGILKLKMFMAFRGPPGGSRRAGENRERTGENGDYSYIALGRTGENWARGRSVGVCAEGRGGNRGQPRAQRSRKGPEQRRADILRKLGSQLPHITLVSGTWHDGLASRSKHRTHEKTLLKSTTTKYNSLRPLATKHHMIPSAAVAVAMQDSQLRHQMIIIISQPRFQKQAKIMCLALSWF